MSKLKAFTKYWLPVLIWAVVIYSASGDQKSVQHSSRIIEPIVRWLIPRISEEAVRSVVLVVRKCAHVTEYAILALILWRAWHETIWRDQAIWFWRPALLAWISATIFAASDEIHQLFVPGRQGSPWDVVIDSFGAAGGLLVLWLRWRSREKVRSARHRVA